VSWSPATPDNTVITTYAPQQYILRNCTIILLVPYDEGQKHPKHVKAKFSLTPVKLAILEEL
jgi:hypothetical protein